MLSVVFKKHIKFLLRIPVSRPQSWRYCACLLFPTSIVLLHLPSVNPLILLDNGLLQYRRISCRKKCFGLKGLIFRAEVVGGISEGQGSNGQLLLFVLVASESEMKVYPVRIKQHSNTPGTELHKRNEHRVSKRLKQKARGGKFRNRLKLLRIKVLFKVLDS